MRVNRNTKKDINATAKAQIKDGAVVEINYRLPYVSITLGNGDEFFFQEGEAADLLDEVPDNVTDKNYLLWLAARW